MICYFYIIYICRRFSGCLSDPDAFVSLHLSLLVFIIIIVIFVKLTMLLAQSAWVDEPQVVVWMQLYLLTSLICSFVHLK